MNKKRKDKIQCAVFGVFLIAFFCACLLLPKKEYSDAERRKLAKFPECSLETVWNGRFMQNFENYSQDQFPIREGFRTWKAVASQKIFGRKDNHGIYMHDGYVSKIEYPLKEKSIERAMERFRWICDKYLTQENQVYFSMIPDKNCYLEPKSGHPSMDYEYLEKMIEKKADFVQYISLRDLLELEDFYRTDTHWRQDKIVDVAEWLGKNMDTKIDAEYEEKVLDRDFYGVYCGQSALPLKPEKITYLVNQELKDCKVYDHQNQRESSVYNQKKAMGKDPYDLFLSGPISLLTMENKQATKEKELVLFRDSFGSSIAPLLLSGYSKITLVDIRYIHPDYLEQLVDFEGCDVLFLYSSMVLNNSETLK